MARPGETEVSDLPEKGKCYEYAEATRKEDIGDRKWRYFTTNVPKYVGKHTEQRRSGFHDGMEVYSDFEDSRTGKTHKIAHSYEGNTSFREVRCRGPLTRNRGTRKLNVSPAPPNSVSAPNTRGFNAWNDDPKPPNSVSAPNEPGFNAWNDYPKPPNSVSAPAYLHQIPKRSVILLADEEEEYPQKTKRKKSYRKTRKHRRGKR